MVSVVFLDCDGVLTTGTYLYDESGKRYKEFSSVDSNGISEALDQDLLVEVISSDPTGGEINEARCRDMGIPYHRAVEEPKETVATRRIEEQGKDWDDVAMMGDDVTDVEVLKKSHVPITVPNAVEEVNRVVKERGGYVTSRKGGRGAVAEAIRYLLEEY